MTADLIARLRREPCNVQAIDALDAASSIEDRNAEIARLLAGEDVLLAAIKATVSRAEQAERALAEAVEVLRPFAEIREALELISANKPGDVLQDERAIFQTWGLKDTPTSRQITLGHLRAARQFVKEHGK